jgi:hypothetical protein
VPSGAFRYHARPEITSGRPSRSMSAIAAPIG